MKGSRANFLILLLLVTPLLVSSFATMNSMNNNIEQISTKDIFTSARTAHGSISISGNYDLNLTAINEGWAGNGSESNPFIIEGYVFTTDWSCISIHDTTLHFIIHDCEFETETGNEHQYALNLRNVQNGSLNASIIHDKIGGIYLENSPGFNITNSNFTDIELAGLNLYYSSNCHIENNTFINSGVDIAGSVDGWAHTFTNNWVNGKPLGYFYNEDGLSINGSQYGQIILADCDTCSVTDAVISNTTRGIALGYSTNCFVSSNDLSYNIYGLLLSECFQIHVMGNTFGPCNELGVHLNSTNWSVVEQNQIHDNLQSGIDCTGGMNNSVIDNDIYRNSFAGISFWEHEMAYVHSNTIFENGDGIYFMVVPDSMIIQNQVDNNTGVGINLGYSSSCTVYDNYIGWNLGGNALDEGSANMWDNGVDWGNHWSDYSGTGTYLIPGAAESVDNYPFQYGEPTTTTTTTTTSTTTTTTTTETTGTTTTTNTTSGTGTNTTPIPIPTMIVQAISLGSVVVIVIVVIMVFKNRS